MEYSGPIKPGSWPADAVERRPLASLIPYARNARTHSPEQVAQIAHSITQFGWTVPILIDPEGVLIAGHGRVLAAQSLKLSDVPVMVAHGWSDAQVRAYRLADNKLSLNAGWSEGDLVFEFEALKADGFDLDLTGFSSVEVAQWMEPQVDPDRLWDGMPEYTFGQKAHRSVIVHFKSQEDLADFARRIGQVIDDKKKFIWHPAVERETLADRVWTTDEAPAPDAALEDAPVDDDAYAHL